MPIELTILVNDEPDRALSEGLVEARVEQKLDGPRRYTLRFELDIEGSEYPMLRDGELLPGNELSVLVSQKGGLVCLVKGPIDGYRLRFEHGGPGSWLEITGGDRCVEMEREHKLAVWPGLDSQTVTTIVESYGLTANSYETEQEYAHESHTQNQSATDFAFVGRLARRNGFHFWISYEVKSPTPTLQIDEIANFRPSPPRDEFPAPGGSGDGGATGSVGDALPASGPPCLNMNTATPGEESMTSFEVDVDVERPSAIAGIRVGEADSDDQLTEIPESPQNLLGETSLKDFAGAPQRTMFLTSAGEPGEFATRAKAALVEAGWFVSASTTVTKDLLGGFVLEPHMTMEVAGIGALYSGDYFVTEVVHIINHVNHTMELKLVRNALGPLP